MDAAEDLPRVEIGVDLPGARRGRGRGRGGGRGAAARDVEEDFENYNDAPAHAQAKYWFGTLTNLEGRNPDGTARPENPQTYIDWRVPEDAHSPGLGRITCYQFQGERGLPTERRFNGLLHIQIMLGIEGGHVRYNQLNQMLRLEGYQAHWKTCRSPPHAWDYCSKDESRLPGAVTHSWGERPKERWLRKQETEMAKIDRIVALVKRKASSLEIFESDDRAFAYRNPKAINQMKLLYQQPSTDFLPKLIYIIQGESKSGKTKMARKWLADNEIRFWQPSSGMPGQWFDDYDNEPGVLWEELRRFTSISLLLRIFDGYEIRLQSKGSNVVFRPRIIIITCEKLPEEWKFLECEEATKPGEAKALTAAELYQLTRRVTDKPELDPEDPPDKWDHLRQGAIIRWRRPTAAELRLGIRNPNRPLINLSNPERKMLGLPELPQEKMDILRPDLMERRIIDGLRENMRREAEEDWREHIDNLLLGGVLDIRDEEHYERLARMVPEPEPEPEEDNEGALEREDRIAEQRERFIRRWIVSEAEEGD